MAQAGRTPPGGGIVQDGLVLWLNGISRPESDSVWADKISGLRFTLNDCENIKNGVRIKRGLQSYMAAKRGQDFVIPPTATIEYAGVVNREAINGCVVATSETEPNLMVSDYMDVQTKLRFYSSKFGVSATTTTQAGDIKTGSTSLKAIFSNKNSLSINKKDPMDVYGNGDITIGRGYWRGTPDSGVYGSIYEIRIYNRQLTEAEILQNQQYDIDTYFGGATP